MREYFKENRKLLLNALLSIIVIVLILTIILFFYVNRETDVEKFNNTLIATIEKVKELNLDKKEYILVEFPDKENIISKSGKVTSMSKKKYDNFTKGYIIIYKDENYALKLSNGKYCATKNFNESSINVDIYAECENYDIEYKKEEN